LPTYQYRCTECDHAFEEFQSFTDDALTVCPVCGGRLRKVYNAVGVVFKGSGFYRNDSRGTTTSSETPAAKTSDASATSSSSSTTDSSTSTSSSSTSAPAASGGSGSSTT
jgi:putative FmdB family regulatory protein